MKLGMRLFIALCVFIVAPVYAATIGEWGSGYGQGVLEYGVQNDSGGNDAFSIVDSNGGLFDEGVYVSVTINGKSPRSGTTVRMTVGDQIFEMAADSRGNLPTNCHVCLVFDILGAEETATALLE